MLNHLAISGPVGAFLLAAFILAITPGPGIMYVMARTLSGGTPAGFASVFGTGIGGLVHVVLAAVGLSALLTASAQAFLIVKYVGAAYLLFLGVRSLLQARHATKIQAGPPQGLRRTFFEGILTEMLNVKTALFFLAFIPQFIDHSQAAAPQFVVFGLICLAFNTVADVVVVLLAVRLSIYLRASARAARSLQYGSGAMLLGLATYVGLSD